MVLYIFKTLDSGTSVELDILPNQSELIAQEKEQVDQVLTALRHQNYIYTEDEAQSTQLLYDILGGTTTTRFLTAQTGNKPVLFFADTHSIKEYVIQLAQNIQLPLQVITDDEFKQITAYDLTTNYDGYTTKNQLTELSAYLAGFSGVVGCIERPHINFLRNLNRGLIENSVPLTLGLLDGPFTTLFTIKPPETGCFECFELRLRYYLKYDIIIYIFYILLWR